LYQINIEKIMKYLYSIILFTGMLFSSCTQSDKKPLLAVINEALNFSEQQSLLMASKFAGLDDTFPRSYIDGQMTTSGADWWCSGFFPGVLWYLYENGHNPEVLTYAQTYTNKIEKEKNNRGTHDLGLMLYSSFGNGYRLTGNDHYKEVLLTGANSLASRYSEKTGLIRSWDFGKWQYPVIIDNMMNLEYLLWTAKETGDDTYKNICMSHADQTMKNHYRPDYSCCHVVSYDTITGGVETKQNHQGLSDESAWSRGQAWGLYGYTVIYRETGGSHYLEQAKNIANFLFSHPNMPADYIPYWDFDAPQIPNEPRDASAGAIIASALIELSQYVENDLSKEYLRVAETQIRAFASPQYTANPGENGDFILKHSVGSLAHNSEVDVPLTYADYYYVEALVRYKKLLQKNQ